MTEETSATGVAPGEASSAGDIGIDEARAIAPREGSTLYYSLLWTEPRPRARFLERLSLVRALARTLDDVHEPGVAERKVHWWHEELERLERGTPRHPRTLACRDSLGGLGSGTAACLDVLSVAASARYTPPATDEELGERTTRSCRATLALLAHALSDAPEDLENEAVRDPALALGLGLHATLARLPALLHRGFAVFSAASYARHGLTPAALAGHVRRRPADEGGEAAGATGRPAPGRPDPRRPDPRRPDPGRPAPGTPVRGGTFGGIPVVAGASDRPASEGRTPGGRTPEGRTPGRQGIVDALVDEAGEALDAALADASYRRTYSRRELAPIARLAALRARQLRAWRESRPDLLRETVTPTPLVKLYIAWRHRRGAR